MKPVILAEKPTQAKAYAEAFTVKGDMKHIELAQIPFFHKAHILHGESAILSN